MPRWRNLANAPDWNAPFCAHSRKNAPEKQGNLVCSGTYGFKAQLFRELARPQKLWSKSHKWKGGVNFPSSA